MAEGAAIFGQGLPRMATSTPFGSRPGSHQPTPREATFSVVKEHSQSSGIGKTAPTSGPNFITLLSKKKMAKHRKLLLT